MKFAEHVKQLQQTEIASVQFEVEWAWKVQWLSQK